MKVALTFPGSAEMQTSGFSEKSLMVWQHGWVSISDSKEPLGIRNHFVLLEN